MGNAGGDLSSPGLGEGHGFPLTPQRGDSRSKGECFKAPGEGEAGAGLLVVLSCQEKLEEKVARMNDGSAGEPWQWYSSTLLPPGD